MSDEECDDWWRGLLAGCGNIVVYCHGGCPDGIGAALLVSRAFITLNHSRPEIIELEHTDRACKAASLIRPDSAILYVDISPYAEDLPLLRKARRVVVVDHHTSVKDRVTQLMQDLPSIVDLSETQGDQCAASLIGRYMHHLLESSGILDLDKKIALLRKKDVWHYEIPTQWVDEANAFLAYSQMKSNATLDMITEFLDDLPTCLTKGQQAMKVLQQNAQHLFDKVKVLTEADHPMQLLVLGVELLVDTPYDARYFDMLCRRYTCAIVLRVNLYKDSEIVDIRVSRTNPDVEALGGLCQQLHTREPSIYMGGGGHPFAAGLQVRKALYDLTRIARDLLHAAGALPAHIAWYRTQDAILDRNATGKGMPLTSMASHWRSGSLPVSKRTKETRFASSGEEPKRQSTANCRYYSRYATSPCLDVGLMDD